MITQLLVRDTDADWYRAPKWQSPFAEFDSNEWLMALPWSLSSIRTVKQWREYCDECEKAVAKHAHDKKAILEYDVVCAILRDLVALGPRPRDKTDDGISYVEPCDYCGCATMQYMAEGLRPIPEPPHPKTCIFRRSKEATPKDLP